MWILGLNWRVITAGLIVWLGLIGLVLVAGGIGQALFPDRPVLTFITYQTGRQPEYRLGVYDLVGDRLVLRPQPMEALVLARDVNDVPALVATSYKQTQIVLSVYDEARGGQRLLSTARHTASGSSWSPDERYYAYEAQHNRKWVVLLVDTNRGQPLALPGGLGNDRLPVWWP